MVRNRENLSDEELKKSYQNWGQYNDRQPASLEKHIRAKALKTMIDMVDNPVSSSTPRDERMANFIAFGSFLVMLAMGGLLHQCTKDTEVSEPEARTETSAKPESGQNMTPFQKFTL